MTNSLRFQKQKSLAVFLSLSEDQILKEGSTVEFEKFILEKRFPFADNCDEFLVVTTKPLSSKTNTGNSRFRFLSLFDVIRLSRPSLRTIVLILSKVFTYQQNNRKFHELSNGELVKKFFIDLLITSSITSLKRKNFDVRFLVGTNSYLSPGLPAQFSLNTLNSTRIIIWYSINSEPILKIGEEPQNYLPPDFVGDVDEHFVWDEYQKADLQSQGVVKATIKKSMVFLPQVSLSGNRSRLLSFKVIYFEVTPPAANLDTLYSTQASIRTLDSLIRNLDSLKRDGFRDLELSLKPKRRYSVIHSKPYLDFVDECVSMEKIELLSPSSNLYEVVRQSGVVLAPPFSSPAIIARELGVPCAFYFLPESDWVLPTSHHGIEVIIESPVLKNFILSAIKKN